MLVFDAVFSLHWDILKKKPRQEAQQKREGKSGKEQSDEEASPLEKKKRQEVALADWLGDDSKEELEPLETQVYSPAESLREKDFSTFSDQDLETIKKVIALITRKFRLWESRRKKADNKARFFDFRRTMRKNIRQGGDLLRLYWKSPKITKTRIVLLCDVSGSMESYSRFLIQFLYGLQNALYNMETFVFSTRLSRITPVLRRDGYEKALNKISQNVLDWSGGTNIGGCLREFNRRYGSTLLYRKTIVVMISDGWDRGEEDFLRAEMERLRKKAYHIIWLNPLLSSPQYEPICKGMRTALPFLDQFLPLHNLDSLIKLGQALYRIN
jgi:uncharacterized protein with von Willebrand factor type A (vWA) domain